MAKLRTDTRETDLIHVRFAAEPPRTPSLVFAKPSYPPAPHG
jgi:hypothetical protein